MKSILNFAMLVAVAASISSCESPELARKRDQQLLEIARLKGELALVEEKLKALPPDRSESLAKAEAESVAQNVELKKLESEIADLELKKASLEKEFDAYKSKYVIR
jgi:predicted  nucleic acid-binding Zn-ribbon protein